MSAYSLKYIILLTIVEITTGDIQADIFPKLFPVSEQDIAEEIARNPILNLPTNEYANAFAAAVNSISWMPIAVARALGPVALPSLNSIVNTRDLAEEFVVNFTKGTENEDADLSIDALIIKYGFPVEIHQVETEDGYILKMFRIPSKGEPVFLMHGLLGSADDFVIAGRDSGLAYLLAESGYDVWMGNARGNEHSRGHVNLEPTDANFWDFSWHEIGVFDLPAMIDYVLIKTDCKSLKFIGHSQGTTSFFVMASERPEYSEKVSIMIALSPVAFMTNVKSPLIRLLAPGNSILHAFSKSLGLYEFLPDDNIIRTLKFLICGTGRLAELLCSNSIFMLSGYDYPQINVSNLPVLFGHLPSGASNKQLSHYAQGIVSQEFRQFDYGTAENFDRYGTPDPPAYSLENITVPISLFYGEEDWLADPKDVHRLYKSIASVVDVYKVPYKQFNHIDFIVAKDVKSLVYNRVLKVLGSF